MPLALIIVSVFFLPMYRKFNVYTAYEYLGHRFDSKTRLLGAGLFLIQRGLAAGITIYAPAIILSAVLGWRLDLTIVLSGVLAIAYTLSGGSETVTVTQKYQMTLITGGMITALIVLIVKLPGDVSLVDALTVAGGLHKMQAVDFSVDPHRRYTFWSGLLGGLFLSLSYFGADQSQVQRYISGTSLRESRLGLMFNAVIKIPMQFFILVLGVLLFVFYQFERPPMIFNESTLRNQLSASPVVREKLKSLEKEFEQVHIKKEVVVG
jgi:SSS family solute:Na+ symporter